MPSNVESFKMPQVLPPPVEEDVNIVLLGSFNPAIFHPEWFLRQGLVGSEVAAEAAVKVVSSEVTELGLGHIRFFCTNNRMLLAVTNTARSETLLDLALGILRLLPHTPVTAAGTNHSTIFKIGSEDHWHKIGHTLAPKDAVWHKLCKVPGLQNLTIQSPRDWDYPLVEHLSVEPVSRNNPKHPAIVIRANNHFELPKNLDELGSKTSTEAATEFLNSQWAFATTRTTEVLRTIFENIPP